MRGWILGYLAAQLLYWAGYGVYYTYTRMYVEETMGLNYSFIALVAAAESAPLLLSLATGYAADRLGRRRAMLLGFGEAGATLPMGLVGVRRLPLLAACASSFHSIAYTAYSGALLAGVSGSGYLYSVIAIGGSVGWALGGLAAGLLHGLGARVEYAVAGLLVAAGYSVAVASTPGHLEASEKPGLRDVANGLVRVAPLSASMILSASALSLFANSISLKMKAEIGNPLLYSLVFSTATALIGAAVRPLAGAASDRIGHLRLYALSTLAYIPLSYAMTLAHGAMLAALWLIPIYPFRDVGAMMSLSTRLPRSLQATAAGIASFSFSLSGFLLVPLSALIRGRGLSTVEYATIALLASSLAALAPYLRWGRRASN